MGEDALLSDPEVVEPRQRALDDTQSWTEREEDGIMIQHVNELVLSEDGDATALEFHIAVSRIGPKAKMAAIGMRWGYKAQLHRLESFLAG